MLIVVGMGRKYLRFTPNFGHVTRMKACDD